MAKETLKTGDTVRPKSGGPLMTVTGTRMDAGTQMVWTVWFDSSGNEKMGFYPAAALAPDDGSVRIA